MYYSTSTGPHCTIHDVKVTFFMQEFSSGQITSYRFRVDNNEDESFIGYDMIVGHDLMVQLGLSAYFKR